MNGTIKIHETNTNVIGEVIIALAHKYDVSVRPDEHGRYINIDYFETHEQTSDSNG